MVNYDKWDHIVDSDDEEQPAPQVQAQKPSRPEVAGPDGPRQSATVKASFIIQTECTTDNRKLYINVCSSNAVPSGMATTPSAARGLDASLPYIVGDVRADEDEHGECYVVECLFHPETIHHADNNKQAAETVIATALAVVGDSSVPCTKDSWSLFEPAALREKNGTYFFAPGKLKGVE